MVRRLRPTYVGKYFLRQLSPLCLLKALVKAQEPSATLQTVPGHLQFIHGVYVLYMHLYTGPVRRFCCPHVQVFMTPRLKIQSVIAVVEVCEFW